MFTGKLSCVGLRLALGSQDDPVAEKEKYGANDVKPGITGWAQINGRDEPEIPVKAKLDGENQLYVYKKQYFEQLDGKNCRYVRQGIMQCWRLRICV